MQVHDRFATRKKHRELEKERQQPTIDQLQAQSLQAYENLQQEVVLFPDNISLLLELAKEQCVRDPAEGAKTYDRILDLTDGSAQCWFSRARCVLDAAARNRKLKEALPEIEEAYRQAQQHSTKIPRSAFFDLGQTYFWDLHMYEEASHAFRRSIELGGHSEIDEKMLSRSLVLLGEYDQALEIYDQMPKSSLYSSDCLDLYIVALEKRGRVLEAEECRRKIPKATEVKDPCPDKFTKHLQQLELEERYIIESRFDWKFGRVRRYEVIIQQGRWCCNIQPTIEDLKELVGTGLEKLELSEFELIAMIRDNCEIAQMMREEVGENGTIDDFYDKYKNDSFFNGRSLEYARELFTNPFDEFE